MGLASFIFVLNSGGIATTPGPEDTDDGLWHDDIYFESDDGLWHDDVYFPEDDGLWHDDIYF